jgi:hypothetical protein
MFRRVNERRRLFSGLRTGLFSVYPQHVSVVPSFFAASGFVGGGR